MLPSLFALVPLALSFAVGAMRPPMMHRGVSKRARGDISILGLKPFSGTRWTFFKVGLGACGKTNVESDFIVALNALQFGIGYPGPHCFKMITMNYNGKTATAQVMDMCPGCPWGGLDLSRGLFRHFATEDIGVLYGQWSFTDGNGGGGSGPKPPATTHAPVPSPSPAPTKTHHYTTVTKTATPRPVTNNPATAAATQVVGKGSTRTSSRTQALPNHAPTTLTSVSASVHGAVVGSSATKAGGTTSSGFTSSSSFNATSTHPISSKKTASAKVMPMEGDNLAVIDVLLGQLGALIMTAMFHPQSKMV